MKFKPLRKDPLVVLMPRDHALAGAEVQFARRTSPGRDIYRRIPDPGADPVGCRSTITVKRAGIAAKPDHQAENMAMAISLVASTRRRQSTSALCAKPAAKVRVVSRPIHGAPPMVELVIGYNEANTSPLLKFLLSKVDELKFRVSGNDRR